MKFGINNDVNSGTKKAGLQLMEVGPSKINALNSDPSNPIHKATMAAQTPRPALKKHRHPRRARVIFCELKGLGDSRIKSMTCKMFY